MFKTRKENRVMSAKPKAAKNIFCASLVASMALMGGLSEPANAASKSVSTTVVEVDGSKSRVNLSSRLRMLNQEIAAAACQMGSGVDIANAEEKLFRAKTQFGAIIKALRESDFAIGVPSKEKKPRILSKIWQIEQEWVKVKYAANKMLEGIRVEEYVGVIASKTDLQAQVLDELVAEIIAHYSNPAEMLTGDAFRINVAARQLELTQRMSKQTCGISMERKNFGDIQRLDATFDLFEKSLAALENGMPAAGIAPPPNDWVEGKLKEIRIKWLHARYKAIQDSTDAEQMPRKFSQFKNLMNEMDNLVTLYMTSTLGQENAFRRPLGKFANDILSKWTLDEDLLNAVREQNQANVSMTKTEIDTLDRQWRKETLAKGEKPLIDAMMAKPVSQWLRQNQIESSGLITEVILTDNKGINVAISGATTDYFQGDEAKWQEPFKNASSEPFIDKIVFDQSTGSFQSQVSMPVVDPVSNEVIGAITFGMNVQPFL